LIYQKRSYVAVWYIFLTCLENHLFILKMTCLKYRPPHDSTHARTATCKTTEKFLSDPLTEKIINDILCKHIKYNIWGLFYFFLWSRNNTVKLRKKNYRPTMRIKLLFIMIHTSVLFIFRRAPSTYRTGILYRYLCAVYI